jgi:hypothetical protein
MVIDPMDKMTPTAYLQFLRSQRAQTSSANIDRLVDLLSRGDKADKAAAAQQRRVDNLRADRRWRAGGGGRDDGNMPPPASVLQVARFRDAGQALNAANGDDGDEDVDTARHRRLQGLQGAVRGELQHKARGHNKAAARASIQRQRSALKELEHSAKAAKFLRAVGAPERDVRQTRDRGASVTNAAGGGFETAATASLLAIKDDGGPELQLQHEAGHARDSTNGDVKHTTAVGLATNDSGAPLSATPEPVDEDIVTVMALVQQRRLLAYQASMSIALRRAYCAHHGDCDVIVEDNSIAAGLPLPKRRAAPWYKLWAIRKWWHAYKWVLWMDTDTLITNFKVSLTTLMREHITKEQQGDDSKRRRAADIILTKDWNGINTGVFLIRHSEWSDGFLRRAWDEQTNPACDAPLGWWDQRGFVCLLDRKVNRGAFASDSHIHYLPLQRILNSYPLAPREHGDAVYQAGDFVAHYPQCRGEYLSACVASMEQLFFESIENNRLGWALAARPEYGARATAVDHFSDHTQDHHRAGGGGGSVADAAAVMAEAELIVVAAQRDNNATTKSGTAVSDSPRPLGWVDYGAARVEFLCHLRRLYFRRLGDARAVAHPVAAQSDTAADVPDVGCKDIFPDAPALRESGEVMRALLRSNATTAAATVSAEFPAQWVMRGPLVQGRLRPKKQSEFSLPPDVELARWMRRQKYGQ